jgi:uncharacterized membrane protein (DUF485 family)
MYARNSLFVMVKHSLTSQVLIFYVVMSFIISYLFSWLNTCLFFKNIGMSVTRAKVVIKIIPRRVTTPPIIEDQESDFL